MYDVNTDAIIEVPEESFEYLKKMNLERNSMNYKPQYIIDMENLGHLKCNRVVETEHPDTEFLGHYYKSKLNYLILQVTQNCNLRCEYCSYSGKYNTRSHSNKRMDFSIAKKGIDYLVKHSMDNPKIILGFYGGEPLLEFELIKDCVEYIKKIAKGKEVGFSITTNGTLLTDKVIDFLVENQFILTISMDGPKEIHDKSRLFVNSKKGSYDILMYNLNKILKLYPKYYTEYIQFNTVLTGNDSFSDINNFFMSDELFTLSNKLNISLVSDAYEKDETKEGAKISEKFVQEYQYELFKYFLYKIGWTSNETSLLLADGFDDIFTLKEGAEITQEQVPYKSHHGGPCTLGSFRLFMTTDGIFFPCEKVCETDKNMQLGNIETGISIDKAKDLLNIETYTEKKCHNCWAYKYCTICCLHMNEYKSGAVGRCKKIQNNIEEKFKDYCVLKSLGYEMN